MPKVNKGRLDGVYGMGKFTAVELHLIADDYEKKITDPNNTDDPKWLQRRAERFRKLANQKENAQDHKHSQESVTANDPKRTFN